MYMFLNEVKFKLRIGSRYLYELSLSNNYMSSKKRVKYIIYLSYHYIKYIFFCQSLAECLEVPAVSDKSTGNNQSVTGVVLNNFFSEPRGLKHFKAPYKAVCCDTCFSTLMIKT